MTLCEALNWCRANSATLYFTRTQVALVSSKGKATGTTIEEAVAKVAPAAQNEKAKEQQ